MKNAVDLVLLQGPACLDAFIKELARRGVLTVTAENEGSRPQWIYVDHVGKYAVSHQALGAAYGPEGIGERIRQQALSRSRDGADAAKKEEGACRAEGEERTAGLKLRSPAGGGPLCQQEESAPRNRIRMHL